MLYSGIFEAVRIRQSGFPMRLLHVGNSDWCHTTVLRVLFFGLLTVQAEFLERYGRLMPKEQWPQLVGPRHFGWFEGRCMKLILDARWHFKGLCNAGLLSFLWRFSTSNICILFRLVGRLRTRQVEQPEKVKLLVAVATSVSQNTIPVRSYLCIIEFHEQQKGSSWSAHHRLGRQGPNPGQHKGFAWVANSFSWRICSESSQTWERIGMWQLLQMQPLGGAGQSTDHESFGGSPPQDAARSEAGLPFGQSLKLCCATSRISFSMIGARSSKRRAWKAGNALHDIFHSFKCLKADPFG